MLELLFFLSINKPRSLEMKLRRTIRLASFFGVSKAVWKRGGWHLLVCLGVKRAALAGGGRQVVSMVLGPPQEDRPFSLDGWIRLWVALHLFRFLLRSPYLFFLSFA